MPRAHAWRPPTRPGQLWAASVRPRSSACIVAPAVQDEAHNRTRFAIICLPQTMEMPPPSSRDCTSLIVSVANRPGAMHDLLVPLRRTACP